MNDQVVHDKRKSLCVSWKQTGQIISYFLYQHLHDASLCSQSCGHVDLIVFVSVSFPNDGSGECAFLIF